MTAQKTKTGYTERTKMTAPYTYPKDMNLERVTEILTSAGMRKNVARTLGVILITKSTKSIDIERMTGLRQPEVSIAIRQLKRWDWIDTKEVKKQGKGRPVHEYSLKVHSREITTSLATKLSDKIDTMKNTITSLANLGKL